MRLKGPLVGITAAAVILILIAYTAGGAGLVKEGLIISRNTTLAALPLLVVSFIVIGQMRVLIRKEILNKWLENNSGGKGLLLSSLAGGLFPGGPYVYYPFVASFAGKEIPFPMFLAFVAGKQVYDFARLPMEISFIGPGIALIRNLITIPVPIIMGLLARYFYPGKFAETPFWKEGGSIDGTNINP